MFLLKATIYNLMVLRGEMQKVGSLRVQLRAENVQAQGQRVVHQCTILYNSQGDWHNNQY